jgi:hypothetical protein
MINSNVTSSVFGMCGDGSLLDARGEGMIVGALVGIYRRTTLTGTLCNLPKRIHLWEECYYIVPLCSFPGALNVTSLHVVMLV